MVYTELVKKACLLLFRVQGEQLDNGGYPYPMHPLHLAEQMDDEPSTLTALLHDVAEDTSVSVDDLAGMGFPADVIEALRLLTHDDKEPYFDYVRRIKQNPLAAKVKAADLRHNSDISRIRDVDDKALKRLEIYKTALAILEESD